MKVKGEEELRTIIKEEIQNFNPTIGGHSVLLTNGVSFSLWNIGQKLWMCEINQITTSATTQWTQIGTLPANSCPPWNIFMSNMQPTTVSKGYTIYLDSAGTINSASNIPANTPLWFSGFWMSKN